MAADDGVADGKPEAYAAPAFAHGEEGFEDVAERFGGHAAAVVADLHFDPAVVSAGGDFDAAGGALGGLGGVHR